MVKCLPTMPETQIRSLGQEDPLEKEMATHSSTLAWKIPWMEEPGTLQGLAKSWTPLSLSELFSRFRFNGTVACLYKLVVKCGNEERRNKS